MKKISTVFLWFVLTMLLIIPVQAATNTKSGTASDIVAVASAQKNGASGSKYIKWYWNDKKNHQWCAAFVSWCANQAGAKDIIKKNASCTQMYKSVMKTGGTVVTKPKPGDLIFYHKNSAKANNYCHVGIVTKISGSKVYTVQGNVDNQVYNTIRANKYQISNNKKTAFKYTIVYVRPNYKDITGNNTEVPETESIVADPLPNLDGIMFNILNKASGRALTVQGSTNASANKSNVQVHDLKASNKNTQFTFTKTSKGWYNIIPASNSKLAVNPYSDAPKNGTTVNVYTKNSSDKSQGWLVEKVGEYYIIRSAYNQSLVLTANGTAHKSNVKLATYTNGNAKQLWSFIQPKAETPETETPETEVPEPTPETESEGIVTEPTIPVSGTTYYLLNKDSGKALDVYGSTNVSNNKANVHIYTLSKSHKSSQFKITQTTGGWYMMCPVSNTKLAVNPYSDKPKSGTNVNVYTKNSSDKTQGWIFEQSGEYFIIRSAYDHSLVLSAEGTANMSNVRLNKYSDGNSKQLWLLKEMK